MELCAGFSPEKKSNHITGTTRLVFRAISRHDIACVHNMT